MPKYRISGLMIEISAPEWTIHDNLRFFVSNTGETEVLCRVIFEKRPDTQIDNAKILVKTPGTSIYEFQGSIHTLSGYEKDIPSYAIAAKNWSEYIMFIDPAFNNPNDDEIIECVRDGLLAALRNVMITALSQKQGLIIHSSTIIWQSSGLMFSAPSGTGKSTHTNLWRNLYATPILDGDATACRMVNGIPTVYGLPWCGTSGEFINTHEPLRAIVFLQQAKENSMIKLDLHESILRLVARSFLLPLYDELMNKFLNIAHDIAENVDCYLLKCRPDPDAVELVKKCLESN